MVSLLRNPRSQQPRKEGHPPTSTWTRENNVLDEAASVNTRYNSFWGAPNYYQMVIQRFRGTYTASAEPVGGQMRTHAPTMKATPTMTWMAEYILSCRAINLELLAAQALDSPPLHIGIQRLRRRIHTQI